MPSLLQDPPKLCPHHPPRERRGWYAYIGTGGNFNEKTANDSHRLLPADPPSDITAEVESVFEYIITLYRRKVQPPTSPINTPPALSPHTTTRATNAKWGKPSGITLKINNLRTETSSTGLCRRPGRGAHPDHPGMRPAPGVPV